MTAAALPRRAAPPARAPRAARLAVPIAAAAPLFFRVSAAAALLAGVALALTLGNPWPERTRAVARRALAWSVVALGAGMDLRVVGAVGLRGVGYTAAGIAAAFVVGSWLGRRLGVGRDTSLLVTVGTAICGGSAIAAVAPVLRARDQDVSVALVTVFLLNGVALFLFPAVGRALHLAPEPFGLWCALAIHDTSSVVGAAAQYGDRALEVATSAKLARALWIVPVAFALARARRRSGEGPPRRAERPWFIAGFLAAAALATYVPGMAPVGRLLAAGAHRALAATLLLIGLGLTRGALRSLGLRPLFQATALWAVMATGTLGAVLLGWISI